MAKVKAFFSYLKSRWVLLVLLLILVVVGMRFLGGKDDAPEQTFTVLRTDVTQSVLLSGTVAAANQADLSFGISGKIESLSALEGDEVSEGDVLARLDTDILEADLLQAEGNVRSSRANISVAEAAVRKAEANLLLVRAQNRGDDSSLEAAATKLQNTKDEQAVLVANALQALLNNDLQVYPDVVLSTLPTFPLTGSYQGDKQGEYSIQIKTSSQSNIGYSAVFDGIESGTVNFVGFDIPHPLGSNGLFITFPSSGTGLNYNNSTWVVPVPNIRSATYQTRLNAYTQAQTTATLAISNAESDLEKLEAQERGENVSLTTAEEEQAMAALEEARGNVEQAESALLQSQANLARVRAQLEDGVLRAPFTGTVARNDFTVGETVSSGEVGITLISDGKFELSMSVPEIDIAKIARDDAARITLDVYGGDVFWDGIVSSIELVETEIDGVPVYESVIEVTNPDNRIRVGMNARAEIVISEVMDVLSIPVSYIEQSGATATVLIRQNEEMVEERIVELGLRGSNNFVEIVKGLSEGDVLIKNLPE